MADVNSARRADRLKREIAERLGKQATLIDITVVDPLKALEERRRQGGGNDTPDEPAAETSPELQEVEEQMLRRQWADWLDTRVPALGNKTPRQAARTAGGRERLEALLGEFARDAAHGRLGIATHLASIRSALALNKPIGQGQRTR